MTPSIKLRYYYWRIHSFLAEREHLLDKAHEEYSFPDEDDVELESDSRL